jgi:hypothetical protein
MPKRKGKDMDADKKIRDMFKEQRKDIDSEPYIKEPPKPPAKDDKK